MNLIIDPFKKSDCRLWKNPQIYKKMPGRIWSCKIKKKKCLSGIPICNLRNIAECSRNWFNTTHKFTFLKQSSVAYLITPILPLIFIQQGHEIYKYCHNGRSPTYYIFISHKFLKLWQHTELLWHTTSMARKLPQLLTKIVTKIFFFFLINQS
jgi:hypothetical protein